MWAKKYRAEHWQDTRKCVCICFLHSVVVQLQLYRNNSIAQFLHTWTLSKLYSEPAYWLMYVWLIAGAKPPPYRGWVRRGLLFDASLPLLTDKLANLVQVNIYYCLISRILVSEHPYLSHLYYTSQTHVTSDEDMFQLESVIIRAELLHTVCIIYCWFKVTALTVSNTVKPG
jgi:hypothetical protein